MANTQDGIAAIKRLVEQLDPLRSVADALTQIGSLDDAITSRKAAHAEAVTAHEAAKTALAATLAETEKAHAAHAQELADHQTAVAAMTADAQAAAAKIRDAASRQAQEIVGNAHKDATAAQAAAQTTMGQLQAQLAATRKDIAEANTELANITTQHQQASANIEAMKQTAQAFLQPKH